MVYVIGTCYHIYFMILNNNSVVYVCSFVLLLKAKSIQLFTSLHSFRLFIFDSLIIINS